MYVNAAFCSKGPSYEQMKNIRANNIISAFGSHFKEPLLIHDGKMQWLFDHTGRRYLDMFGGIVTVSVGHCHP
jgi:alanine-glyoxylate transaminase/(R)-3-amino-2-methylpropionate-pyruvate transaminase